MRPTLHTDLHDRTERQNTLLGAHFWRVGPATDTLFALVPGVSPASLAADIQLWDTLEVVRALDQARAAGPGATEDLLLVLAVPTGGRTIADRAGGETAGLDTARTGNVSLVVTNLGAGRHQEEEEEHKADTYHI